VELIAGFHDGMQAAVRLDGKKTDKFDIINGLRQGCVMAPDLFDIFFSMVIHVMEKRIAAMLSSDPLHDHIGVEVKFDTHVEPWMKKVEVETKIEMLGHYKQRTKVPNCHLKILDIWNLLFADDAAMVTTSNDDLQYLVTLFNTTCDDFGLSVSIPKTEVLCQKRLAAADMDELEVLFKEAKLNSKNGGDYAFPSEIQIEGHFLKEVFNFKYLGSLFSKGGSMKPEYSRRLHNAQGRFERLHRSAFQHKYTSLDTKVYIYRVAVVPILLWDCNNWNFTKVQLQKLESFNHKCLLRLMRRSYHDKLNMEVVIQHTRTIKIEFQVRYRRLKALGRMERMEDTRLPKIALYGSLQLSPPEGVRKGRKSEYTKQLQDDMKIFGIDTDEWRTQAADEKEWNKMLKLKENELNMDWMNRMEERFLEEQN
jgi:hypothetical protein